MRRGEKELKEEGGSEIFSTTRRKGGRGGGGGGAAKISSFEFQYLHPPPPFPCRIKWTFPKPYKPTIVGLG